MHRPSRFVAVCFFLLCFAFSAPVWAQGSPVVYFSTGNMTSPSQIDSLSGGTVRPLISVPATADWESLVVGPGVQAADYFQTVPSQSFDVYACDPKLGVIIRFDPNNLGGGQDTVSKAVPSPVCGRFNSKGSLIVDSKNGSGPWEINGLDADGNTVGISALPLGTSVCAKGAKTGPCFLAPQQVSLTLAMGTMALGSGRGLATKNEGAELIADNTNGQILLLSYPFSTSAPAATLSTFVAPNTVPSAVGIARNSVGDVFVSTQARNNTAISEFDSQGNFVGICGALPNGNWTPNFMQMSLDDTLYVALSSNNKGEIVAINSNSCNSSPATFALSVPVVGLALPPTATGALTPVEMPAAEGVDETFFVGNNAAFQLNAAGHCTPTASAEQVSPTAIQPFVGDALLQGTAVADLWSDDFETVFNFTVGDCQPPDANGYVEFLSLHVDNLLASNPRVLACDGNDCSVVNPLGNYPLGGILPKDSGYTGRTTGHGSLHFLVNEGLNANQQDPFCGFDSPLLPTDPSTGFASGIVGPLNSTQNLAIKFKVADASQGGTCKSGPYVSSATAMVSVAQIAPSFTQININSSGNSTPFPQPNPPTIKADTKQQYQLSLSLKGYLPGTYQLTVTFLTNNTIQQTVEFQVQ